MATSYYFWGTSKSGFAKRERKDNLLMHAPIFAVFSFFFLPLSFFFLSFSSFFLSFLGYVCFGFKSLPEMLFRKCGCLVAHGK